MYAVRGKIREVIFECIRIIDIYVTSERYESIRDVADFLMTVAPRHEKSAERVFGIYERAESPQDMFREGLRLARIYVKNKKTMLVQYTLEKLLALGPDSHNLKMNIARVFAEAGMSGRALAIFKELLIFTLINKDMAKTEEILYEIKRAGGSPLAVHFTLGEAYWQLDDLDSAAAQFTEVMKLDRGNMQALKALGCILYTQEHYELAIKAFNKIIASNPNDMETAIGIAQAYIRTGQIPRAMEYFVKTAKLLMNDRKYNEAYKMYKKILDLDPDNEYATREILKIKPGKDRHAAGNKGAQADAPGPRPDMAGPKRTVKPSVRPAGGLLSRKAPSPAGTSLFKKREEKKDDSRETTTPGLPQPGYTEEAPAMEAPPPVLSTAEEAVPLEEAPPAEDVTFIIDMPDEFPGDTLESMETEPFPSPAATETRSDDDFEGIDSGESEPSGNEPAPSIYRPGMAGFIWQYKTAILQDPESTINEAILAADIGDPAEMQRSRPTTAMFEELLPDDFFLDMILGEADQGKKLPAEARPILEEFSDSLRVYSETNLAGIITLGGEILWNPRQVQVETFSTLCSMLKKMNSLGPLHEKEPMLQILEWEKRGLFIATLSQKVYLFALVHSNEYTEFIRKSLLKARRMLLPFF
jgi:tetratricopeptide (TPR) repeat protein